MLFSMHYKRGSSFWYSLLCDSVIKTFKQYNVLPSFFSFFIEIAERRSFQVYCLNGSHSAFLLHIVSLNFRMIGAIWPITFVFRNTLLHLAFTDCRPVLLKASLSCQRWRGDKAAPISGEAWRGQKGEPRRVVTWIWRCNRRRHFDFLFF